MHKIHFNYIYSFKYNNCSLDNYCISSTIFKSNICFIDKPKHKFNLTFNHPVKELIWAAKLYGV